MAFLPYTLAPWFTFEPVCFLWLFFRILYDILIFSLHMDGCKMWSLIIAGIWTGNVLAPLFKFVIIIYTEITLRSSTIYRRKESKDKSIIDFDEVCFYFPQIIQRGLWSMPLLEIEDWNFLFVWSCRVIQGGPMAQSSHFLENASDHFSQTDGPLWWAWSWQKRYGYPCSFLYLEDAYAWVLPPQLYLYNCSLLGLAKVYFSVSY